MKLKTLKIKPSVHTKLLIRKAKLISKLGKNKTFSDIIGELLNEK